MNMKMNMKAALDLLGKLIASCKFRGQSAGTGARRIAFVRALGGSSLSILTSLIICVGLTTATLIYPTSIYSNPGSLTFL